MLTPALPVNVIPFTVPVPVVKLLEMVNNPEEINLISPLVVVKVPAVVSAPPLLSKSMLPVPVERAAAGNVKTPDDLIVNGLFVASVGVANVKLPVLEMKAPPDPDVKVKVPVVVVNIGVPLDPILPALAVGTVRVTPLAVIPPVAPMVILPGL